ncbi:MAG: flagellar biosynthetic protein FliO [Betaproteobacteria bacterium]
MTQHNSFLRQHTKDLIPLVLFAFSHSLFAQTATTEAPGVSNSAILQMLLGLTLIIGVLFSGAYLLRRINGGKSFGNAGAMKIIGGLMISARERIVLIEVGESWIVVGIVPGQIKTLHTLPKGELPPSGNIEMPFGQWLKQFTERNNENK